MLVFEKVVITETCPSEDISRDLIIFFIYHGYLSTYNGMLSARKLCVSAFPEAASIVLGVSCPPPKTSLTSYAGTHPERVRS